MDYKISEVISFSEQTYGQWGSHRAAIKVEGNNNLISAFMKVPPVVGDQISGEIKTVEKGGKTYHNFEFAKKSADQGAGSGGAAKIENMIKFEVLPAIKAVSDRLDMLVNGKLSEEESPF